MKKLFLIILTFTLTSVQAQTFKSPDILVKSKLDYDWSEVLIGKVRRFLNNIEYFDPFKQSFEGPILISDSHIEDYLSPSANELVDDLGQMIGMNFLKGKTQITLHDFEYDISRFGADLKTVSEKSDGYIVESYLNASNLRVSAKKLTLSLVLQGKKSFPAINIEIINPVISAKDDKLINFFARLKLQEEESSYKVLVEDLDFEELTQKLMQDSDKIDFKFDSIQFPEINIKASGRTVTIESKKVQDLLNERREAIKELLIAKFSSLIKSEMGEEFIAAASELEFDKEYWIDSSDLYSQVVFKKFSSGANNLVEMEMPGDFCTAKKYHKLGKECLNEKVTRPADSLITREDHLKSVQILEEKVLSGDANMVVSVSEDYVNKLLAATYDAGLWDDMLKSAGVVMGPKKAFIRLDQKNSSLGTLYMDLLYTPKKLQRMAVGTKEVRFPLVIKAGLKIKEVDGNTLLIIHLDEIDTSENTLLNGVPSQGLVSSISNLRFKKKIIDTIQNETAEMNHTEVLELNYPELNGLGLSEVELISDGHGRMNALLKVKAN